MNFHLDIYVVTEKVLTPSTLFFHSLKKSKKTLDNKGCTEEVLMDLSKAFDKVNRGLLIVKLYA